MIKELRLQHGWSQEQLAQMSGLSIRTIQRIERGTSPSLESLKSLAAVFEMTVTELQQTPDKKESNIKVTDEEQTVIDQVRAIKSFYSHLTTYLVVMAFLFAINLLTNSNHIWAWWPALGWGIGVVKHGLNAFEVFHFLGPKWEKKQIEKRLGRKL
ncbi:2TM domain-containing protein [Vibrio salinus]|uniref:2TM domain-containing protein n=1 Tax=Vibrio salinus TaxID=2899784 RepID=UPI001E2C5E8D|nr:2TM domain-containing protein [Vibrio salinus]MCE0492692.1 2TM domain-containing protein [Vibrio salinus]